MYYAGWFSCNVGCSRAYAPVGAICAHAGSISAAAKSRQAPMRTPRTAPTMAVMLDRLSSLASAERHALLGPQKDRLKFLEAVGVRSHPSFFSRGAQTRGCNTYVVWMLLSLSNTKNKWHVPGSYTVCSKAAPGLPRKKHKARCSCVCNALHWVYLFM